MKTSTQTLLFKALTIIGAFTVFGISQNLMAGNGGKKIQSYILSWWSADASAEDICGNRDATLKNGTGYLPGVRGMAFNFNRCAANYVEVPHDDVFGFGTSDFTIQTWANFRSLNISSDYDRPDTIFVGVDEGPYDANKWFFCFHSGKLAFHINNPSLGAKWALDVDFVPETDKWYNLVVVRQGGVFQIYVNGVLAGTDSSLVGVPIPNPNAPLTIGQAEGIGFMDGMIDETVIYTRALTASQIQQLYKHLKD